MGRISFVPAIISLRLSSSRKQNVLPTQEDYQARFYTDYRKVAEEYDKEFLKKYDEDLNTTLIFVNFKSSFSKSMLTRVSISGRSVLCRSLRLHHRCQLSATT